MTKCPECGGNLQYRALMQPAEAACVVECENIEHEFLVREDGSPGLPVKLEKRPSRRLAMKEHMEKER